MVSERPRAGILLLQRHEWSDLRKHARDVEAAGFDKLFVADHFYSPFGPGPWLECWTLLAALARETRRIRLGPLVTNVIYRHPAAIAQHAMTVDQISEGRLDLGIGSGGSPLCHTMTGTPMWPLRERVDRFGETVEIIDRMLRQERTTHQGKYYQLDEAQLSPRPVQQPRPPLLIAADGPRALRIVAKHGDAWVVVEIEFEPGVVRSLDETGALNEQLDDLLREEGRDPAAFERWALCGFASHTAFSSLGELQDLIGGYRERGIGNFVFNYLPGLPPEITIPSRSRPSYFQYLNSPDRLYEVAEALKLMA